MPTGDDWNLIQAFYDLRGTMQGPSRYAEGVRCEDGRDRGPLKKV